MHKAFLFLLFFASLQSTYAQSEPLTDSGYSYNFGGCGFMSESSIPSKAVLLLEIVEQQDYLELKRWIRSSHPEVQAFGVTGFHFLCTEGIEIKVEDQEIIDFLKESMILVNTCSGCMYGSEPMRNLLRDKILTSIYWYFKEVKKKNFIDSPILKL